MPETHARRAVRYRSPVSRFTVTSACLTRTRCELLTIEAAVVPGKGQLTKTGSLGDVMAESITAALTSRRSRAQTNRRRTSTRSTSISTFRGRRYAEGWPERRHRHVHGAGFGDRRHPGARRRGNDRGDHPAWQCWRSAG
ncbi:hypothetical protein P4123_30510 [Pseudomonas aeruginosa]|nr:hypothetical protein [Pseudomonas aeruginosa]